MSVNKSLINQESSGCTSPSALPVSLKELSEYFQSADLFMGLLSQIQQEQGAEARWAARQPLCAKELVQTLFSKKKFANAVVPFFSLCDKDPGLRKALQRIASNSDQKLEKVQGTIEKNIQSLAEHPELFFELGHESLNHKNRRLAQALFSYCGKNPTFVQKNLKEFSDLVKRAVHLEDLVVLEFIFDHGIDQFLEKKEGSFGHNGGLNLGTLLNYQRWNTLDLLIQKGKVPGMVISKYELQKGKDQEKIDLMIANGAVVEKPTLLWEDEETNRLKKAFERHEMYKTLHEDVLTIDFLKTLKADDLWWWLSFDFHAASVLAKFPDFFNALLLQQSDRPPYFERALKVYSAAGIFDQTVHGVPLLFKAIFSNNDSMAEALLCQGVPAKAVEEKTGWTAFEAALRCLRPDGTGLKLFEFFLNHPATDCHTFFKDGTHPIDALFQLDIPNKLLPLKAMLKKGAALRGSKLSLLERAAKLQPYDVPALKLLISHGLFLGEMTPDKDTVLHVLISSCAASSGLEREAFLQLIAHVAAHAPKAFDGVVDSKGKTVLDTAKEKGVPEAVLILLQAGIAQGSSISKSQPVKLSAQKGDSHELKIFENEIQIIEESYRKLDAPKSSSELRPWMNLTNITYLFGDAIVKYGVAAKSSEKGSESKGRSFEGSGSFLAALLSVCEKTLIAKGCNAEELQAVEQARQKLERAVFCFNLLSICAVKEEFRREYLPILSSTIEAQIAALAPGETLLLPSGWTGQEGRYHAMLIEVGKNADGTCSLTVINTDKKNGALLHAQRPTELKTLINPVRAFNGIPQEELFDSSLVPSLLSLLAHFPEDGANQYGDKDYYHVLFSRFSGYAVSLPPDKKMCFITAQRSGTCTIRCALAYLHIFLGTELYRKVKTELEEITFQAINDPQFLEKSAVSSEFLQHLEHAIERAALRTDKQRERGSASLLQAKKMADLLSDVEAKIPKAVESSKANEKTKGVDNAEAPPLQQTAMKLKESRQKLLHLEVKQQIFSPFQPLVPPSIDFSKLASGDDLIGAIDQLNDFFEQSFQNPMDPHQTIATRMATEALSTLALPNKGIFYPGIDEKTLIGSLSVAQKELLQQKLGNLCQKYATAMNAQRSAAAIREQERFAMWYGDHEEPFTEAESVEQYLCINKLFAYYWRLSLGLEGKEMGSCSLCHYGIDVSHLKALQSSVHLPCYSPQVSVQLNGLIEFFEQSHPSPKASNRTLLAIGSWSESGENIELPLANEKVKEGFGDSILCDEWYQRIPEKWWSEIDRDIDRIKGWTKPDLKKFRMAHLFAHPEMLQHKAMDNSESSQDQWAWMQSMGAYSDLRKMAFTCWLFKNASHQELVQLKKVEWSEESHRLETKLVAKSRVKDLVGKARSCCDPFHMGKLGHPLLGSTEHALRRTQEQNEYTIDECKRGPLLSDQRYYEIAHSEEFAIHRLLCHYKENISDLKNSGDQTFFQLLLFGKEQLAQAMSQDPSIGNRILSLIDQALYEFNLELQADPTKENVLHGIVFLNVIKLRLEAYLPGSFSQKERMQLQQEIVEHLERIAVKESSSSQSESVKRSSFAGVNKVELRLLWICAQPESSWSDLKRCEQVLTYLGQFELYAEQLGSDDASVDPSLRAFAYQTVFAHLNALKKACDNPEVISGAVRQIAQAYGIHVESETVIKGAFPQVHFVQGDRLYEINLLSGIVARDKVPLVNPSRLLLNSVISEFAKGRNDPIEIYVLGRTDQGSRFYSRSGGNEYYFTVHKVDQSNWVTQIEWQRGSETFCHLPFDKVPDEFKQIALENPPKQNNYYYWVSKGPSKIAGIIQNRATGVEEVIIYADGTAERPLSKERWNYLPVKSIPILAVLASMQSKEQIAVWEKIGSSNVLEVNCFGLHDSNGAPFRFQMGSKSDSFDVVNLPGYSLSDAKTVKGLGRSFPYLVVENGKGRQKALVPVKIWSEAVGGSKDPEKTYSCEEIAIDEKGNPSPSGIQQLLLAYYFIGAKQYDRALGLLKQIDESRAYTPDEFKMLGWILLHSKKTKDHSPKAVALSLMAARLANQNLENFPDAHPQNPLIMKVAGYYDEPKAWVQFWKGSANWEKTAGRPEPLSLILGQTFERYYEISSHCTPVFQIHGKQLTSFEELQWLAKIIQFAPLPALIRRFTFLLTGKPDPIIEEAKPEFAISFKFPDEMTGFDWLHSIDASSDDYRPVLAFLDRIRPEKGLKEHFGKLYALATKGTAEEKQDLLIFLKDMQYDPNEVNQLIRGILMSQLPPYDSGPASTLFSSYQSGYSRYSSDSPSSPLTMSQAIAKKVVEINASRYQDGKLSPYEPFYGYSNPEKQLSALVREWQKHFFPSSLQSSPKMQEGISPDIQALLPPLSEQRKEKLAGHYEHSSDKCILEMNSSVKIFFAAEKIQPSTTAYPSLPATMEKDPYFQMRGAALRKDIEDGMALNDSKVCYVLKEKKTDTLLPLKKDLLSKKEGLQRELKGRLSDIQKLVKQVRGGDAREIEAQLLRLGKKDVPPALDECIAIFVQRDIALYQQRMPFLSLQDCLELDNMIGEYLLLATTEQRVSRSLDKLNKVLSCAHKGKSTVQPLHNLALEMNKKREFTASDYPEMLVLEYYADISMREEQCLNLIKMTTRDEHGRFPPLLLQMIMSAGKTSVLGTLLALMKADGYHLSILFTPRSLLDSNAPEMKERNQSFFGQRGHTLTFNRGKAYFNVPNLLRLQHMLLHAIVHREYLILCPETLLSMQNQYIEAREKIYSLRQQQLSATPAQREKLQREIQEWEAPAQELKKILLLIRQRGAATFDEIDAQSSPRKELNYPGIETTRLDKISVELVSALYEIASTDPELIKMGLNLKENTQSRLVPSKIEEIKPLLVKKIVHAIQSNPLWCQHLGLGLVCDMQQISDLTDYLLNPGSDVPKWITALNASGSEQDRNAAERIALIRQEIAQWLPSCWKYSANEHFGRSKEHPDYLAAKPNICASTPNESAEIAHAWELVNKTLQLYVSTGIDKNQAKAIVESLQKLAIIESRKIGIDFMQTEAKNSTVFDKTEAVQFFKKAVEGSGEEDLDLMKLQANDQEAMKRVQKVLNAKTPESTHLIIKYLNEQVFPKLEFHRDQIHNNTANLSGAVDSEQGYSGTTANLFIFSHAYLQAPDKRIIPDKGAYGKVIDKLCRANRTVHTVSPQLKTAKDLMKKAHEEKQVEERNRFHAFIDIGAHFKGHSNADVAASFLDYFSELKQSPIEGILYYDDATNQLACLKKGRNEPILIGSTDAKTIFAKTGLKKNQLFTYYDQFHTRGANIIQDPRAKAFYTIGDQTVLNDELQGDMRMRGLLEEQEVEGIISQDLIPLIAHRIETPIVEKPSIEQILLFGEVNGLIRDREDNLKSFLVKLTAAARKHVLDKLYISKPEEEEVLYAAARTFFIKPMTEELFSQYGGTPKPIDADKYIEAQIQSYSSKIDLIEPHMPPEKVKALRRELEEIASMSVHYIPPKIDTRSQGQDNTVEKIADIEKKVDNLSELDLESQEDLSKNQTLRKAEERPWQFDSLEALLHQLFSPIAESLAVEPMYQRMSDVMNSHGDYALFSDSFSPEFLVSNNFIETVSGQSNLFEKLQKTPYETLLFIDPKSRKPYLLVLSTKEAQGFLRAIEEYRENCPFTLLNGDGSFRAGASVDLADSQIQQLIVQMLFFSGRLSLIQEQKWEQGLAAFLKINRAMKRDFFEAVALNSTKLMEYEHSMLKRMLNAPSETVHKVDPVFTELKSAYFAMKHGNGFKCKESVEKHFSVLGKERPEELCIVINIARTIARSAKSASLSKWGSEILLESLPFLKSYAETGQYKPMEKMIQALKEPVGEELKTQIVQALTQMPEVPIELLKKAYANSCCLMIDEKTQVAGLVQQFSSTLLLLKQFSGHLQFEDLVTAGGVQLMEYCIPKRPAYSYSREKAVDKSAIAFDAIVAHLRNLTMHDGKDADLFIQYARPFLTKYLGSMHETYLRGFQREEKQLLEDEKKVLRMYQELSGKYCGVHPELDKIFIEQMIHPIVQGSYRQSYSSQEYSLTESSWEWQKNVEALLKTKHPYALEQAENLRLKFEKDDRYELWF